MIACVRMNLISIPWPRARARVRWCVDGARECCLITYVNYPARDNVARFAATLESRNFDRTIQLLAAGFARVLFCPIFNISSRGVESCPPRLS